MNYWRVQNLLLSRLYSIMNHWGAIKKLKKDLPPIAQTGLKNFIIPTVDSLIASQPEFMSAWILARGLYGSLFDIKQEEINEFVEYIQNNKTTFVKEVIETKEFRDGFILIFEAYIKQRNEKKRRILQSIFLDFTETQDKKNFELERLFDLLNKISEFQFYVLKKVKLNRRITVEDRERNVVEFDYGDLKYLEYLGLLYCDRKSTVESNIGHITEEGDGDVDSELLEEETFYLSPLGGDFVKFIEND